MIDNIDILRAIDEHQQQAQGRPLWQNGLQLLNEITGTFVADPQLMLGFLQELFVAEAAGHLTWRLTDQTARPDNANYYLQQIQQLALTQEGQDRARGRMIERPAPAPGEDDGHDLSDLVLQQVAEIITREYAPDQRVTFLAEEGIPPGWLQLPDGAAPDDVHAVLAATWRAGSLGRQLVRRFLGRWLDGQLITGPDGELRASLVEQLARQGWQIRQDDSVLVAAEPVRGIPVSAPFLREARLHPLIEAEARPQFMVRKYDHAVLASLRAVEIRVRALGGYGDQMIGVALMTRAFGTGGPLTDPSAPAGEQDGVRTLFAGAFGALRNPAGHRQVDYDDLSEAAEAVQLASLLMRILDRAEARLVAAGRTARAAAPPPGTP